jgi:hypothetical protein
MCSEPAKDASLGDKGPFICHTTNGRMYWPTHVKTVYKIQFNNRFDQLLACLEPVKSAPSRFQGVGFCP